MAQAALIIGAVTSLAQYSQQRTAATIQRGESKVAAKAEELAATQREADRKARLASAMASQIATSGARNIAAFEGSPLTILEEDIRREKVATERDRFQSQFAQLTERARGRIQSGATKSRANIGLLQDVSQLAQTV